MKVVPYNARATLGVSVKNRNEFADYDYLHKLSEKDLYWLKGFHNEWVQANFKHKYKKHAKSFKRRKQCFDMNNSRNRDIYAWAKVTYNLVYNFHEPEMD